MKTQTKRRDAEVAKARRAIAAIKPEPFSDSALSWKFARCVSALLDLTDAMTANEKFNRLAMRKKAKQKRTKGTK